MRRTSYQPPDRASRRRPDVAGWLLLLTGVAVVVLLFGSVLVAFGGERRTRDHGKETTRCGAV